MNYEAITRFTREKQKGKEKKTLGTGSPHNRCLRAQRTGNEKTLWYRVDIQNWYIRPFKVHFSRLFDPVWTEFFSISMVTLGNLGSVATVRLPRDAPLFFYLNRTLRYRLDKSNRYQMFFFFSLFFFSCKSINCLIIHNKADICIINLIIA